MFKPQAPENDLLGQRALQPIGDEKQSDGLAVTRSRHTNHQLPRPLTAWEMCLGECRQGPLPVIALFFALVVPAAAADVPYQVKIQYIEACSRDLFCPCYFNDHASHQGSGAHMCNFNNVGRVLKGKYGDVELTGLKFWLSGDLGADWATKGQADWLVATFEPKATKEQKDAMMGVLGKIYPVK